MRQVIKQVKKRCKLDLQHAGIKYQLWRLDKSEYEKLRENSLPIADDFRFYLELYLSDRTREDRLNLAETFIILEWIFGESSNLFDDWKGSFCFPILLVVKKQIGRLYYLMSIYDRRGSVYFSLYRIIENSIYGYETQRLREPFEFEFSRQEINCFLNYFYEYLKGYFESVKDIIYPQNFIKKIDSNLIIYGYKNGEYFEDQYDSEDSFQEAIRIFEEVDGVLLKKTDIDAILQEITSEFGET
ncbi:MULTISPECIES: hypothetical protein [Nostocales]|uniref:Uncharacterized protein n=3 Tax=Nostocales TaxID=1161 RepID=A0A0C1R6S0_9CYAN|nr:hypothetical protein [Tolypothrix bouteillei]KAF3887686.1 hypothetical protein DA73_0400020975 [Tolypothrix bouteillei VB521301]